MLYIFNNEDILLDIISDEIKNKSYAEKIKEKILTFETTPNSKIIKYNKIGFLDSENKFHLFLIDDVTELSYLNERKILVECISDISTLAFNIIEDKRVINGSLNTALTKALEGTKYKVGNIEQFDNKDINFYFISSLKALNDILDLYRCEYELRIDINKNTGKIENKYIDIKHRLGEDTGLRFTFDTNLKSIEKIPIATGHFNVLYGRGKALQTEDGGYSRKLDFGSVNNGKKYIEDLESIRKYGRIEGIYENSSIENEAELLQKTKEKLKETKDMKYSYKISIADLSEYDGFEHYKTKIGDTIIILDEEDDVSIEARIIEIKDNTITLGNYLDGLFQDDNDGTISNLKDKVDIIEGKDPGIDDTLYPDLLPAAPVLTAKGLYSTVAIEWTYENKSYYTYEIYASKLKGFNPDLTNRIFEGKASACLHEVKPSETWYYRARAKNTHDKYTKFSVEVKANTNKISDAADFFEQASIADAIIGELKLDRGWVGKLVGQHIDARNLTVSDGNGNETLNIDSFGNVKMNLSELKINATDISNIADRVTTTEEKLTPGEIVNSVNVALADGTIVEGTTTKITKDSFEVSNASGGKTVLSNGNISTYGSSNKKFFQTSGSSLNIHDWSNENRLLQIARATLASRTGITFSMENSSFFSIGEKNSDGTINSKFFINNGGWVHFHEGVNFNKEEVVLENMNKGGQGCFLGSNGSGLYLEKNEVNTNAKTGNLYFNYWRGSGAGSTVKVRVGDGSKGSYGPNGHGDLVCGSLWVHGDKHCIKNVDNIGFVGLHSYETAEPYFGDMGSAMTDENGFAYVPIEPIFMQTVNTSIDYKVFITIVDDSDDFVLYKVVEKKDTYFKVRTSIPNVKFDFEIKARKLGSENKRLDRIAENIVYPGEGDNNKNLDLNNKIVSDNIEAITRNISFDKSNNNEIVDILNEKIINNEILGKELLENNLKVKEFLKDEKNINRI